MLRKLVGGECAVYLGAVWTRHRLTTLRAAVVLTKVHHIPAAVGAIGRFPYLHESKSDRGAVGSRGNKFPRDGDVIGRTSSS